MKRATYYSGDGVFTMWISIHALVKRATSGKHGCNDFFDISIHALVKRATKHQKTSIEYTSISIHALVKRATRKILTIC